MSYIALPRVEKQIVKGIMAIFYTSKIYAHKSGTKFVLYSVVLLMIIGLNIIIGSKANI